MKKLELYLLAISLGDFSAGCGPTAKPKPTTDAPMAGEGKMGSDKMEGMDHSKMKMEEKSDEMPGKDGGK
jgi:hypothetical protein